MELKRKHESSRFFETTKLNVALDKLAIQDSWLFGNHGYGNKSTCVNQTRQAKLPKAYEKSESARSTSFTALS